MSEFGSKPKALNTKHLDECIFGIAKGDLSFMNELYELTHVNIYSYALSSLKNRHDAEDVTHDCYITVYNSAYLYESKGKPLAWMITIVRNLAMARIKERNRLDEKDISEYQFTHEETVSAIDRITLDSLMNHLNDEEREVVVLHSSGFRHREIAQMTGLSLSGVLSKYNRAMKKLKERYEKGMKNE